MTSFVLPHLCAIAIQAVIHILSQGLLQRLLAMLATGNLFHLQTMK